MLHAVNRPSASALVLGEQTSITTPEPRLQIAIRYALVDGTLSQPKQATLDTLSFATPDFASLLRPQAVRPQVAVAGDRYVFAWFDATQTLKVATLSATGASVCGADPVPSVKGSWSQHHALASAGAEVLAVVADPDGNAVLYRLDDECHLLGEPQILNAEGTKLSRGSDGVGTELVLGLGHPAIAATASGFAVTWIETEASPAVDGGSAAEHRIMLRLLGPRLCD
jgi:hypothetical protein